MSLLRTMAQPGIDGPLPTIVAPHGYGSHAHELLGLGPLLADGTLSLLSNWLMRVQRPGAGGK